ncbi:triose-phosphate isomerase [Candidatus Woesearchaeota archaeon]|nr:triose-phosphate isomerase [Candidatus Woesearchaeota archaeon]
MPLFIVNFKTYENGTGKKALRLAKIIDKVAVDFQDTDIDVVIAVQPADIRLIADKVSIPVFAQHVDPTTCGSNTGSVLLESVIEAGARGAIINHSEHRMKLEDIKKTIRRAKKLDFPVIVCVDKLSLGEKVSNLRPDFIAIELPELIGGKKSISLVKPNLIKKCVKALGNRVIAGSGIRGFDDVKKAIDLGANGVLVANAIVNAKKPEKVLKDLLTAF